MRKIISVLLMVCLCVGMTVAQAAGEWICDACGTKNAQNFCGECGAAKPEWVCTVCGQSNSTRFCGNCGSPKESSPAPTAAPSSSSGKFGSFAASSTKPVTECFSAEPRYVVYDAEDQLLGRFAADAAYMGDYAEGDRVMISLQLVNETNQERVAKVTAVVNGEEFSWKEKAFAPGASWNPRLSSKPMQVGEYEVEWFVDGVSVLKTTYVVREGESPLKTTLMNDCEITMSLCLWNDTENVMEKKTVLMGDLNMNDPDKLYGPRLQVDNNSSADITIYVSLCTNDGVSSWTSETIKPGNNFGFVSTRTEHVKGENTCVWYINGFKVLEGKYYMGESTAPAQN